MYIRKALDAVTGEGKTIVWSSLVDHFYSSIEKEDQIGDYVTNV
jgi:hypothetical protein